MPALSGHTAGRVTFAFFSSLMKMASSQHEIFKVQKLSKRHTNGLNFILGHQCRISRSTFSQMPKLRYLIIAITNGTHAFMKLLYYLLFYRTKPTGQGTGLRLSLAYDIVKAHGGELKIESKEGEGATFNIGLPILQAD